MARKDVRRWATFSKEEPPRCRFDLGRDWDLSKGFVLFVGLNPSLADHETDDMTVVKGMGFSERWGYGGTVHVNAFPFITPYPSLLGHCTLEEIDENDRRVLEWAGKASLTVLAWGAFPLWKARFNELARLLARYHPVCLGRTAGGFPKHISRIGYDSPRTPWAHEALPSQ